MTDNKKNTDHLHDAGVINKADLSEEHSKAVNSLSKEEIEHLKSIDKNMKKTSGSGVGVNL
ncbi:MAG: hypothetical protein ACI9LM_003145 [Alteromonadaceae bacterium]|jgi:hypothetical protein